MNIYLIRANSYHLINEEIKKIVLDNPYLTMNLNKSSLDDVIEEASYYSLIKEKKYLVVTNANFFSMDKISDKDSEKLIKYLNNPNPETIIIFTTLNSLDNRKKIVKLIKDKYQIINISPWDKKKIREEATKYLNKFGYKIDYETMSYIIDNTYDNIDVLYNELDKIMLYYNKECFIKLNDVLAIVGRELDNNNFHFVNAVVEKNLASAIHFLANLKVYKVEVIVLINLLAREYRLMYYVKKLREEKNMASIVRELNLQNWQVDKLYQNGLKYSEKEILKNIYLLGEMDLKIKNGEYDKDIALYPFLLEVCE